MSLNKTHTHTGDSHSLQSLVEYEHLELNTFQYTEHHSQDMENDIDPENNFFANINNNCNYYTDEQFNRSIKTEQQLSIIHFNSRSLYANFHSIKHYLKQLKQHFNIIAITETWINSGKESDFGIEGYEMFSIKSKQEWGWCDTIFG